MKFSRRTTPRRQPGSDPPRAGAASPQKNSGRLITANGCWIALLAIGLGCVPQASLAQTEAGSSSQQESTQSQSVQTVSDFGSIPSKSVSPRGVARIRQADFPDETSLEQPVSRNSAPSTGTRAPQEPPAADSGSSASPSNVQQNPPPPTGILPSPGNPVSEKALAESGQVPTDDLPLSHPTDGDPKESSRSVENEPLASLPAGESPDKTLVHEPSQAATGLPLPGEPTDTANWSFDRLKDRKTLPATIQMIVSVAAISLVPAILLMTTCFIRIVVVLGILRQAIGLQQLPPTQVTTALALMMTFLIMAPTWQEVKRTAIDPYTAEASTLSWEEAWQRGVLPVKKFMWSQIRRAENEGDFWVFYDYLPEEEKTEEPDSFEDIPLKVLLPAFMISELKVAFLIGIQVLLPFLILDIVVASLCNTMGLIMLPPSVVSLPLKLLLFVMVDGWNLVVAMLLNSFALMQ